MPQHGILLPKLYIYFYMKGRSQRQLIYIDSLGQKASPVHARACVASFAFIFSTITCAQLFVTNGKFWAVIETEAKPSPRAIICRGSGPLAHL